MALAGARGRRAAGTCPGRQPARAWPGPGPGTRGPRDAGPARAWLAWVPQPGWTPAKEAMTLSDRDDLLKVINDKAVTRGDFVLSSGQRASWYIDLRRGLLSGASAAPAGGGGGSVTARPFYGAPAASCLRPHPPA